MDVCKVVDECSSETREGEWRGREDRKRAKPREREVGAGFIADSGGEKGRVREKREKKRRKKLKKIEEKD